MAHKVRRKPPDGRVCPICGGAVPKKEPGSGPGAARKYCSVECAKEAARGKVVEYCRERRSEGRQRCPTCGQLVPVKRTTSLPVVS